MSFTKLNRLLSIAFTLIATGLLLASCGGGGGSSNPPPVIVGSPPPPPVQTATDFNEVTAKSRDDSDGPHLILMPGGSALDIVDLKAVPNAANRGCTWKSDLSSVVFADNSSCETTLTISDGGAPGEGTITVTLDDDSSVTRSFEIFVNTAQETYAVRNAVREGNIQSDFFLGEAAGSSDECGGFTLSQFNSANTGFMTSVGTCNVVYDYVFSDGNSLEVLKPLPGRAIGVSNGFITGLFSDIVLVRGRLDVFEEAKQFTGPTSQDVFLGGTVSRNGTASSERVDQAGVSANDRIVFVQVADFSASTITFRAVFLDLETRYGIYDYTWKLDPSTGKWFLDSRTYTDDDEAQSLTASAVVR